MRVSIVLPVAEDEDQRATPYRHIRQLALSAEAAGLDAIYAADHIFYRPGLAAARGFWESWTLMSALAEATSRVELGHLVLCVPFRNPVLLAYMANTLDEVSGGRLVLGLGSGWHEPEFRAAGFEFERRVSVFDDYLAVTVPLLREGRVRHDGRFAQARVGLRPAGPRAGGPPILIASKGPRMHGLAARYADRWNVAWYGRPSEPFWQRRDGLFAACREIGRDPAEMEINVGLDVVDGGRGDPDREVRAEAALLAEVFGAWQEQGVAELICRLEPSTPEMVERVAHARAMAGVDAGQRGLTQPGGQPTAGHRARTAAAEQSHGMCCHADNH